MKKVTNITLGGIIFVVEEDAFEALSLYLKSIETKFASSPDYEEISGDIEDAIAEKFRVRGKNKNKVVTKNDVDEVVGELGTADEVSDVEIAEENKTGADTRTDTENYSTEEPSPKKRLYRDLDEGIISGVSAGLAKYFDVDPVIVRVIFIITAFLKGIGILAYAVLWLIVPAARTTADKYAMRGERMTVADITERVKKNLNDEENIKKAKGAWGSVRGVLAELFDLLGKFLRTVLHFLRYAIGIILILLAAVGTVALVSATSVFWMPDSSFINTEVNQVVDVLMEESVSVPFVLSAFVVLFIPLIVVIVFGASLLAGRSYFTVPKSITLFIIWIIAVTLVSLFGVNYGPSFINKLEEKHPELFKGDHGHVEIVWDESGRSFVIVRDNKNITEIDDDLVLGKEDKDELSGSDLGNEESELSTSDAKVFVYDGVEVSKSAKSLNLSGKNLTGSLKAEVRQLSDLEQLDLSDNNFTGLPAEIGQLEKLEILILKNNNFTGLPHELGNLKKLELLDLSGNNISEFDLEIIRERLSEKTVIKTD